jgi:serine/threonine-protein kinase
MKRLPLAVVLLSMALCVGADPLPRFPPNAVWNRNIATAPPHPQSAGMISTLTGLGGFGFGRMQIDFGMHVVHAPAGSPTRTIVDYPYDDYYSPDCEPLGSSMPVPANAAIESTTGLVCDNENEDCHLLVVQGTTLYEAYHVTQSGANALEAQCLVKWHLTAVYPGQGRGDHCTSADAAGFPIAPLLFNADDVHAAMQVDGDLGHALRFILPNARMASDAALGGDDGKLYVRPATHAGNPFGPAGSVPYGARLRLRADFPFTGYSPAAQVLLRTMQRYGIVLADGGNIALTAESDRYTTHDWDELGIGSRVFDQTAGAQDVLPGDFQVIDTGPRIPETYNCARTDVGADTIFTDGLE